MLFYFVVLLVLPLTEAVPSQVTGVSLSVVSGQSAITVNWNKPSSDRPITGYEVKPYTVHGSSFNSESTLLVQRADSLTTVISNLERGTTYAVRVRAVSDAGNGDYSPLPDPIITIPNLMSAPFPTYLPGGGNSRAIITVLVEAILLIIVIVMAVAVVVVKCSCRYIRRDSDLNAAVEMTQSPAYESVDRVYENANHGQSPRSQQCYLPKNEDYAVIISKVDGSDFNAAEMTQSPAYESVDAAYI